MTEAATGRRPLVFGEVLFDCFPDGGRVLGGAPFNVAWHLHALGLDPLLVNRVGVDDAGDAFAATLIAGLLGSWPVPVTLRCAQQLASRICGLRGAVAHEPGFYQAILAEAQAG